MEQVNTDKEAILLNGAHVEPLLTIEDEGSRYQVIKEESNYALCVRVASEHLPKGVKGNYALSNWWPEKILHLLSKFEG